MRIALAGIYLLDAVRDPTMYRCSKYLRLAITVIPERPVKRVDGSVPKIIDHAKQWTELAVRVFLSAKIASHTIVSRYLRIGLSSF
jgi:hypothetical protein